MTEASFHALRRTSAKGEKFVGDCVRCGRTGMTLDQVHTPCANTSGLSDQEAIMTALGLTH